MHGHAYAAEQVVDKGISLVRLSDEPHGIKVSIAPSLGNRAYEMLVRGENILHFPFDHPSAAVGDRHLNGIPFLAPWANRMPDGFYANGKYYRFNAGLNSIRPDQNGIPIHGLLSASPRWEVIDVGSGADSCHVTSRLEFWKYPDLMANWPFAHNYEMTFRLSAGVLEVGVSIDNRSAEPMPVAVGFHPYFQLPGVPIGDAVARIPARSHVETNGRLVATGETTPVSFGERVSLNDHRFDDGFTDLVTDAAGRATFSVEGRGRKIEVAFGPNYPVAIVYAPPGQNYICFEPMSALTNGVNLAHEGKCASLQTIPPGGCWQESFWIRPDGF